MSDSGLSTQDLLFLQTVRDTVANRPHLGPHLINAVTEGYSVRISQEIERAVDMEVVASMALHTRLFNSNEKIIIDKLQKYHDQGRASINWKSTIETLNAKIRAKIQK